MVVKIIVNTEFFSAIMYRKKLKEPNISTQINETQDNKRKKIS